MELGGHSEKLFLLWTIAAELAYQQNPEVFGTVEDLPAHKARIAELDAKRAELHKRFPGTWGHNDLHIGRITSDGAALITFAKAAGEVPVHPPETAGQRLVEYLLRQEHEAEAKAA
jgi:light-regulated signal transduction histidine kinase (bacteriophytochrome)